MKRHWVGCVVALLTSEAAADYKSDLERAASEIKKTPPRTGVEQAPAASGARPGWCAPLTEEPYLGGMTGHLSSYYENPERNLYHLVGAAQVLCKNDTNQPVIKLATREIVQIWMNTYGLSAADAVESLKLTTIDGARDAGQKKTCDALKIDDESGGAERAFLAAKREIFGCSTDSSVSVVNGDSMARAVPWLDSSAKPFDELVRLAFVSYEATAMERAVKARDSYGVKKLLAYAINQFDFKALDAKLALQAADADPMLKGNAYARTVIKEKLGLARLAILAIDEEVKQKAEKDADWKAILITAPQQGYADYIAATAKYKTELQRSADVEQLLFGASRKAMAGCQKSIKPDLSALLKTMKRETIKELIDSMNANPVAGLLFRRFQACVAVDGDVNAATEISRLDHPIRVVRGPRAAAYYATIDAIGKIRADRDKFPVTEHDVPTDRGDILNDLTFKLSKGGDSSSYSVWKGQGVIKSMKKGPGGIAVVFAKDKQQVWSESCTNTNRIVTFDHDAKPIYDRSCKGKVVSADVSPDPITVPEALAEGLAPNRLITFGVSNSADKRISMPFEIFKDKKGKGLVAWMTIAL